MRVLVGTHDSSAARGRLVGGLQRNECGNYYHVAGSPIAAVTKRVAQGAEGGEMTTQNAFERAPIEYLGDEAKPTVAQVAFVFAALREHAQHGGTYRYLIYERLGFDESAYGLLCLAGGMFLSNMLYSDNTTIRDKRRYDEQSPSL